MSRLLVPLLLLVSLALAAPSAQASPRWVASWAASPVVGSVIPWSDCPAGSGLTDQTVVFSQSGVRTVILLEGVNDIGFDATAPDLIAGLRLIADRTHAAGLRVIGGTITPFGGSFIESPSRTETWAAVNDWIRHSGTFDAVVDFAAATAAPGDPMALNPAHDSGDHLHPNDSGTEAMAAAIDLSLLLPHHLATTGYPWERKSSWVTEASPPT